VKKAIALFRRHRREERGATLIFTALAMVLLLWAGATGVDLGFSVYGSRQAQAMADTAALDLVRYISYSDATNTTATAAQSYFNGKLTQVLTNNNSNAQLTVFPGYFNGTKFTKYGQSGTCQATKAPPVLPGCNAIEVTAAQTVPQVFFGGFNVLHGHSGNTVTSSVSGSSVAAVNPEAAFSIGSYLASINTQQSAVLNKILSPLDTSANLTLVGFEGLANSDVTLAGLISASAGLLSPTNILSQSLTAGQWASIFDSALLSEEASVNCGSSPTPDVCSAYTALNGQSFSNASTTKVSLCQLVHINLGSGAPYDCNNTSIPTQGLNSSLNVYQLLNTEAMLSNGTNSIDLTAALNLSAPGLLNIGTVTLKLAVGQVPQVAYGPVGTTASTAQVTATLSVNLATLLGINLGTLTIPLSAASGTATLTGVTCINNAMSSTSINTVTTTLATGTGDNGITLTLLGLVSDEGTLTITGGSGSQTFTGSEVPPTTATATATPKPTNPQNVYTTAPTLTFTQNNGINSLVAGLLTSTSVLAEAYGPVLQALGIEVAGAQVTDMATNCGSVSLVQ
jgi:uncharacterized membrane protein